MWSRVRDAAIYAAVFVTVFVLVKFAKFGVIALLTR